ncbi:MAG: hypothetical protein ABEJ30_01890 [Halorientalis sp.]
MTDSDTLSERLRAVERALSAEEGELTDLADATAQVERLEETEERVADLADRVAELEASVQAIRGYVGNVRAVEGEVEQRADAALATAEAVEQRLDERESLSGDSEQRPPRREAPAEPRHDGGGRADPGSGRRPPERAADRVMGQRGDDSREAAESRKRDARRDRRSVGGDRRDRRSKRDGGGLLSGLRDAL